jgi:glycosyltransferase involved in cell wall biosynthesis
VLYLSNLAYDTERVAVQEKCWNRIWVPSTFLCNQLFLDYSVPTEKIDIIPPVLKIRSKHSHESLTVLMRDLEQEEIPLSRRLVFPHRSDPAKGISSAIGLLLRLAQDDHRWRLIVTAPSTFDDAANQSFFRHVLETTKDVYRHLKVIPWLPHDAMGNLYAMSGCTIMASTLPESFGLTAAESVLYGTPVVAIEAGALSQTYCELRAVHFVDEIDSDATADITRNICDTRVSQEIPSFLLSHFSMETHVEAVQSAIASLGE